MHVADLVFGLVARGPRFFSDGWGDRALCEATDPAELARRPPARLDLELGPPRRAHGGLLQEGSFTSPEGCLPDCARRARIRLLLPDRPAAGVAVHLAASGDQGFGLRLRFAAPLLEQGIGALVLEQPFYGARRPPDQPRHAVRSVSDLHLMGRATFLEARGLLRWLREVLRVPRIGVTGYSMGGQFAAMAGASWPGPLAVVPVAPTCSPDSVLRDGVLRHVAHWRALAGETGDELAARTELVQHLERFSVTALPPPVFPRAAIVVGTSADGVVPPAEMEKIARHWGAELRWLPAGHVTAVVLHLAAMRQAIADAFQRLPAVRDAASLRLPASLTRSASPRCG